MRKGYNRAGAKYTLRQVVWTSLVPILLAVEEADLAQMFVDEGLAALDEDGPTSSSAIWWAGADLNHRSLRGRFTSRSTGRQRSMADVKVLVGALSTPWRTPAIVSVCPMNAP